MSEEFEIYPGEPFPIPPPLSVVEYKPRLLDRTMNTALARGLTISELTPLNLGVLLAVQTTTDSRLATMLAFTGATLATEVGGAVGSAQLLDDDVMGKTIRRVHRGLVKLDLGDEPSGVVTDFITTVIGGTTKLNVFKRMQDPTRERVRTARYAVAMGLGNTAVSAVGYWFGSEYFHFDIENVVIGGIGVPFAFMGAERALKYVRKRARKALNR